MAKAVVGAGGGAHPKNNKKTSQGLRNIKRSSMSKTRKRSFKKYRGQGK